MQSAISASSLNAARSLEGNPESADYSLKLSNASI